MATPDTTVSVHTLDAEGRQVELTCSAAAVLVIIDSRTLQCTITIQPDGTIQTAMRPRLEAPLAGVNTEAPPRPLRPL